MGKNIVIGVGNMLFKDEGIGIYASEYIKQNYVFDDENLEVIDGGTLGFKLMSYFQEYENVDALQEIQTEKMLAEIALKDILLMLSKRNQEKEYIKKENRKVFCKMLK